MRKTNNAGFSLIELIVVMAIMGVLSGLILIGPEFFRQKEIEKYNRELCDQITLMQTVCLTRSGEWRLALYADETEGVYYCIQERWEKETDGSGQWMEQSGRTELGVLGGVTYTKRTDSSEESGKGEADAPLYWWSFDRGTGACTAGYGTYEISGAGMTKVFKVYKQSGRCDEVSVSKN